MAAWEWLELQCVSAGERQGAETHLLKAGLQQLPDVGVITAIGAGQNMAIVFAKTEQGLLAVQSLQQGQAEDFARPLVFVSCVVQRAIVKWLWLIVVMSLNKSQGVGKRVPARS